ncbi:RHS repeat domain-containing protein [Alteromonas australica]|uniref:Teneurin-like YD-shell domain-containing protein n=1 Tax=Alteromonas australica TaxID=589873 RepID=A0A075P2Q4_9ALTE|nr:RHS repeat-associated core domain-containing protein [Alteromonas australica]AIF99993.1 hypothetical protein EP13_15610 [Alteromonas australica]
MPVLVSASETSCDNSVETAEKTTFTYDNLGNIRKVSYGDGTDDKVYTYDKNSNLTSLEYGDVIQNYTYNDLNLVESERLRIDGFDWTISYLYDNHGNRKNVVYPGGGSLWYQPNPLGQPQRVGVFATSISFHPNGLYKSVTLKNGCVNTQTLYTSGYPNIQRSLCGTRNIVYNQYSYDGNGNITFWDDKQSNTYDLRLTYDGLDRLDNIRNGNNSLIGDLNYDSLGNIEKFDSIAGTINYTYDANERLYSTSGMRAYTFTYDDRGNVEDNGFDSFTYNLANEMRSASGNSYVYDGHGKRVKAVDSEGTRYSMYSLSGQLLYERINGAYRQNYYLGSQLIAHQGAGEQTFIHPDILGTTAGKTNSDGGLIKRLRYAPFGLEWGKTNASSGEDEIGYTGHKHDKSIGLTYMQARYYDPVIGRFYSNDPIGFRDVHSFNRYAYANNNPFKYVDPTGMASRTATGQEFERKRCKQTGNCSGNSEQDKRREKGRKLTEKFVDSYDTGDPNYHQYEIGPSFGCLISSSCTVSAVAGIVDSEGVPFKILPPGNGETSLLGINPINHFAIGNFSVNVTLSGHWFHPGVVVHATFESQGAVWFYSRGVGTGKDQFWNMAIGYGAFGKMHSDVSNRINTEILFNPPRL